MELGIKRENSQECRKCVQNVLASINVRIVCGQTDISGRKAPFSVRNPSIPEQPGPPWYHTNRGSFFGSFLLLR